jgi:hypothetical protein
VNRDLLFVGSDVAAYVSTNRGASWRRFMTGMPTVPVHDLQIHPRDHEIIAATHGRSIWIADITPLQQMTDSVRATVAHLFTPRTAHQFGEPPALGENTGDKTYEAQNDQFGAALWYRVAGDGAAATIAQPAQGDGAPAPRQQRQRRPQASLLVTDARGDTVATLTGPATPGLHRVTWDFRGRPARATPLGPAARRDSILTARRIDAALDSLERANAFPKPVLDRVRAAMKDPQGMMALFRRGGRGGGAGEPGAFAERPAERFPAARPAAAPGAPAAQADVPQEALGEVFSALRSSGAIPRGFGFGGGRGGAQLVNTGDYLVTLTVNGRASKQLLRVERTGVLATQDMVSSEEEMDEEEMDEEEMEP